MAMRNYGIETNGMVLTLNEFQKLVVENKENIIYDFYDINDIEIDEIIEFLDMIDFATFIADFHGYLNIDEIQEMVYFGDKYGCGDDIVILELKKNNLYDKYENKKEIIEELKETLSEVGIKVNNDYVEEHFGYISGSYVA